MDILQTKNLTKCYGEEPLVVKALDGITLQIEQGSFTAIVGTSGSGKSTLLHMLGGGLGYAYRGKRYGRWAEPEQNESERADDFPQKKDRIYFSEL